MYQNAQYRTSISSPANGRISHAPKYANAHAMPTETAKMKAKTRSLPVEVSELLRRASRENSAACASSLHSIPAVIVGKRQHPRRACEMYHRPFCQATERPPKTSA